jgi:hypothetical protein
MSQKWGMLLPSPVAARQQQLQQNQDTQRLRLRDEEASRKRPRPAVPPPGTAAASRQTQPTSSRLTHEARAPSALPVSAAAAGQVLLCTTLPIPAAGGPPLSDASTITGRALALYSTWQQQISRRVGDGDPGQQQHAESLTVGAAWPVGCGWRRLGEAASALSVLRGYDAPGPRFGPAGLPPAVAAAAGRFAHFSADSARSRHCAATLQRFFAPPAKPSVEDERLTFRQSTVALFLHALQRSGRFSQAELATWLLDAYGGSADVARGCITHQHRALVWSAASSAVGALQCLLGADPSSPASPSAGSAAASHAALAGAVVKSLLHRLFHEPTAATAAAAEPAVGGGPQQDAYGSRARHAGLSRQQQPPLHVDQASLLSLAGGMHCCRQRTRRWMDAHLSLLVCLDTGVRVGSFVSRTTERELLTSELLSPAQSVVCMHILSG